LVDNELLEISKKLLKNKKIILPIDFITSSNYRNIKIFNPFKDKISKSEAILDIGPETVLKFSNLISKAQTIFLMVLWVILKIKICQGFFKNSAINFKK